MQDALFERSLANICAMHPANQEAIPNPATRDRNDKDKLHIVIHEYASAIMDSDTGQSEYACSYRKRCQ